MKRYYFQNFLLIQYKTFLAQCKFKKSCEIKSYSRCHLKWIELQKCIERPRYNHYGRNYCYHVHNYIRHKKINKSNLIFYGFEAVYREKCTQCAPWISNEFTPMACANFFYKSGNFSLYLYSLGVMSRPWIFSRLEWHIIRVKRYRWMKIVTFPIGTF